MLSHTTGILLIALALGYVVCYFANREERTLRRVGFIVGVFVIALSLLLMLANLTLGVGACNKMNRGMMSQHMMMKGQMPSTPIAVPQK